MQHNPVAMLCVARRVVEQAMRLHAVPPAPAGLCWVMCHVPQVPDSKCLARHSMPGVLMMSVFTGGYRRAVSEAKPWGNGAITCWLMANHKCDLTMAAVGSMHGA
jgi:hypothetical protein